MTPSAADPFRHCERSEAIHGSQSKAGLLRRYVPRKDGGDRSALCRRNIPDAGGMFSDILDAIRQMDALVRWRTPLHTQTRPPFLRRPDRPRTRLNSSHLGNSYAVFCLKKKKESAF